MRVTVPDWIGPSRIVDGRFHLPERVRYVDLSRAAVSDSRLFSSH
jgi:hypothetical protein